MTYKSKIKTALFLDRYNIHELKQPMLMADRKTTVSEVIILSQVAYDEETMKTLYLCIPVTRSVDASVDLRNSLVAQNLNDPTKIIYSAMHSKDDPDDTFITVDTRFIDSSAVGVIHDSSKGMVDLIEERNKEFKPPVSHDDPYNEGKRVLEKEWGFPERIGFLHDLIDIPEPEVLSKYDIKSDTTKYKVRDRICQYYGLDHGVYIREPGASMFEKRIEADWTNEQKLEFLSDCRELGLVEIFNKYGINSKTKYIVLHRICREFGYNPEDYKKRKRPLVSDTWSDTRKRTFMEDYKNPNTTPAELRLWYDIPKEQYNAVTKRVSKLKLGGNE